MGKNLSRWAQQNRTPQVTVIKINPETVSEYLPGPDLGIRTWSSRRSHSQIRVTRTQQIQRNRNYSLINWISYTFTTRRQINYYLVSLSLNCKIFILFDNNSMFYSSSELFSKLYSTVGTTVFINTLSILQYSYSIFSFLSSPYTYIFIMSTLIFSPIILSKYKGQFSIIILR